MQIIYVFDCAFCDRQERLIKEPVSVFNPGPAMIPKAWAIRQNEGQERYWCPQCLQKIPQTGRPPNNPV